MHRKAADMGLFRALLSVHAQQPGPAIVAVPPLDLREGYLRLSIRSIMPVPIRAISPSIASLLIVTNAACSSVHSRSRSLHESPTSPPAGRVE